MELAVAWAREFGDPEPGMSLREDKERELEVVKATLRRLAEIYPAVFDNENPKPFMLGISQDFRNLRDEGVFEASDHIIQRVLGLWAAKPSYLKALKVGAPRFGLDMSPKGAVTADEAVFAKGRLKIRKAQLQAAKEKELRRRDLEVAKAAKAARIAEARDTERQAARIAEARDAKLQAAKSAKTIRIEEEAQVAKAARAAKAARLAARAAKATKPVR